jgi:hypothetical protein
MVTSHHKDKMEMKQSSGLGVAYDIVPKVVQPAPVMCTFWHE